MGLVKKFFYISCLCPLLGWADPAAQMAHSQAVDVHVINQNGFTQSGSGTAFVRKTKDKKDIVFILTCVHVIIHNNITGERSFPKSLKVTTPKGMVKIDNVLVNNMGLKIGFDVAVLITTNNVEMFTSAMKRHRKAKHIYIRRPLLARGHQAARHRCPITVLGSWFRLLTIIRSADSLLAVGGSAIWGLEICK